MNPMRYRADERIEDLIITDERLNVRAVAHLATDMANVGHRHCRIGMVRLTAKPIED